MGRDINATSICPHHTCSSTGSSAADQLDADGPGELSENAQGDGKPQREGAQVPESLGKELPGLTMRTKETCVMLKCNNDVVGCCSS